MAHKRNPRRNKVANMLVTREDVINTPKSLFQSDRENIVKRMTDDAVAEVRSIICDRYVSARNQTEDIASKMNNWDKQYEGEFQNEPQEEGQIFLNKTKEQVKSVYSYIMLLVSQLDPIVTMHPFVSNIQASTKEFQMAKVAEALFNFYMKDVWHVRDDVFPAWLKTFLKYSMAIWKVSYVEDDYRPDLNIEVIDRAFLYMDPYAKDLRDCRWVIEKSFLTKAEVIQMVDDGHWYIKDEHLDSLSITTSGSNADTDMSHVLRRYFGNDVGETNSIDEDELIEIWHYWQAPSKGLTDVYAVFVGGEDGVLARYGRNPYPYKGIPYRGKSYDPDEYRPDGTGMVEEYAPIQELVNNLLNLRTKDVRKNIIGRTAVTGRFIDETTMEDYKNGNSMIRLSEEAYEASKDPAFNLGKHFHALPSGTSTSELLIQDLPFILNQGKENSFVSDVFRGQSAQPGATLGQVQEQLSRNQGAFRPVYLQVMRGFEELGEICMEYFKSPEFFPEERIIQIVGKNRYKDIIPEWHNPPNSNMFIRTVTPDELDVQVFISSVSAADAIASRTFLMNSIEQIFRSIGQIPGFIDQVSEKMDLSRLFEFMINSSGQDIDALMYSPDELQQRQQEAQQAQQQQQQAIQQAQAEQQQMALQMEQMKSQFKQQEQVTIQQARAQAQAEIDANKSGLSKEEEIQKNKLENQSMVAEITEKLSQELRNSLVLMREEFRLESLNSDVSVGHGNNVNE